MADKKELVFYKDEQGRIIKVARGEKYCEIVWNSTEVDIEFCNYVIQIVCSARGVGKEYG